MALSCIFGLGVGAALRAPAVWVHGSSPVQPVLSVPVRPSVGLVSAPPAAVSSLLPAMAAMPASAAAPAIAAPRGSAQPRVRDSGIVHRTPVLSRARFDSENPYGR